MEPVTVAINTSFNVAELMAFGIETKVARTLSETCTLAQARGWIAYTKNAKGIENPAGFVVSRLQSGELAPTPAPASDTGAHDRRRYTGEGTAYEGLIQH